MTAPFLVAFVGPSGAGKSTAFGYAAQRLRERGFTVVRRDVALPLRVLQRAAFETFGRPDPGDPQRSESFIQDGALLQFLALHFEDRLGPTFEASIRDAIAETTPPLAIVNTDCRNNAFPTLRRLGFRFVRIEVPADLLQQRRAARGDLTAFDPKEAVEAYDRIDAALVVPNDHGLAPFGLRIGAAVDRLLTGDTSSIGRNRTTDPPFRELDI